MFKPKIFFFNLRLGKYSRGKQLLILLPVILVFSIINTAFITSEFYNDLFYLIFFVVALVLYFLFSKYCNWFSRWDKNTVKLRIENTRLDIDPSTISSFSIRDNQFELVRINRIDTIDVSSIRIYDQKRLILELEKI
jgi:hypothetical protein